MITKKDFLQVAKMSAVALLLILGAGALGAANWVGPTGVPTNANVNAPVNVGSGTQTMGSAGNTKILTLFGSFQASSVGVTGNIASPSYCFGSTASPTNCISAWPSGGAGGVTDVTASAPLASSRGTTPNISLTGTVPIAAGCKIVQAASGAYAAMCTSPMKAVGGGSNCDNSTTPSARLIFNGPMSQYTGTFNNDVFEAGPGTSSSLPAGWGGYCYNSNNVPSSPLWAWAVCCP
ncbi:MAG: hypothetical protein PHV93_00975 [Candidatus Pacebacteria bacterium]|nr:hypothetical protein [Candidatus Paceibacterota bacterium]